ncbi:eCIS core domain-containing protein [Nannocystis pusilla]|uniref:eCIS core domain-containing protein n=1 Tax=Nannocystis pusilla TaxID=889268 RepID=UPI003DA599A3
MGGSHDPLEREADLIAHRVMDGPAVAPSVAAAPRSLQRKCAACEETDEESQRLQRRALPAGESSAPAVTPRFENQLRQEIDSGARPLDPPTRSLMESRFAADFSRVRIHDGPRAHALAEQIEARAFTTGRHIFFNRGEHRTDRSGRYLLAHELTHTLQQGGAGSGSGSVLSRKPKAETDGSWEITPYCAERGFDVGMIGEAMRRAQTAVRDKLAVLSRLEGMNERRPKGRDVPERVQFWNENSFACWFGPYRGTRFRHVHRMLKKIDGILRDPEVVLHCREPEGKPGKSWASSRRSDKVVAVSGLWKDSERPYTRNEDPHPETLRKAKEHEGRMKLHRAATLVHEAAHFAGANRVLRETYDREDCAALARKSPFRAVRNADNYGWFVLDPVTSADACIVEQESWSQLREDWAENDRLEAAAAEAAGEEK